MIDEVALVVAREPLPGASETPVGVYLIDDAAAGFNIIHEHHVAYDAELADSYVTLAIKAAQFDHDNISEFAIVLNENTPDSPSPDSFASQYLVFEANDDQLITLSSGPISATILNPDSSETTHQIVVADLAVGDLDGDSVDELVFGGLENVISSCENAPDPDFSSDGLRHLVAVYGNTFNEFSPVAGLRYFRTPAGCDQANEFTLRFTHVNVLDFDGDGDNDIHINDRVYDGPVEGEFESTPISQLFSKRLITADGSGSFYDRSNSTMTVSDQTGDGIDDVVALLLSYDQPPNILVFSWNPDGDSAKLPFEMPLSAADIQGDEPELMNPIVTPVDVDNDSISIIRYTGEHFLDFTEPVVLAALAAAPCIDNIGQNTTDSCSTSWGDAQTGAAGRSFTVTLHGSVGVGVGAAGAGASVKSLAVFSAAASRQVSDSYELTVSRTFSTGPFEDGVVFTSMAMDRYVYQKIAAGLPDDGFVGERILVNLPRGTDIRLVTREYYNSSLSPNPDNPPLRIDENIFQHTPGNLSTYPTEQEKDAILADAQAIVNKARRLTQAQRFSPIVALPGLEVGPVSVGEGGGASELALEYTESFGSANALELGFEFVGETLAGAAASFSVGLSAERELEVSHGDTTLYAGSVGSIPEENYARNQYEFGLFAYLMAIDDQEFEVINFWVEQ